MKKKFLVSRKQLIGVQK